MFDKRLRSHGRNVKHIQKKRQPTRQLDTLRRLSNYIKKLKGIALRLKKAMAGEQKLEIIMVISRLAIHIWHLLYNPATADKSSLGPNIRYYLHRLGHCNNYSEKSHDNNIYVLQCSLRFMVIIKAKNNRF